MLPQALLRVSTRVEGDRIVPHYLTVHDEPWLRSLMDECARFVGRKRSELHERLREPLPTRAPKAKLRIAIHVLDGLCRERTTSACPAEGGQGGSVPEKHRSRPRLASAVITRVAESFGVTAVELESALFADLRGERLVAELPKRVSPSQLALDANIAIVSSLIRRAAHVRISVWGNSRALVRHARLMGLICRLYAAKNSPADASAKRLGGVEHLPATRRPTEWCSMCLAPSPCFATPKCTAAPWLRSCLEWRGAMIMSSPPRAHSVAEPSSRPSSCVPGIRLARGESSRVHDSRLEERFDRDFRRAALDWDVIREPRPVSSGNTLIFPRLRARSSWRQESTLAARNRRVLDAKVSDGEARTVARGGHRTTCCSASIRIGTALRGTCHAMLASSATRPGLIRWLCSRSSMDDCDLPRGGRSGL